MNVTGLIKAEEVWHKISPGCDYLVSNCGTCKKLKAYSLNILKKCSVRNCPIIANMQRTPAVEVAEVVVWLKNLQDTIHVYDEAFEIIGKKIKDMEGL